MLLRWPAWVLYADATNRVLSRCDRWLLHFFLAALLEALDKCGELRQGKASIASKWGDVCAANRI